MKIAGFLAALWLASGFVSQAAVPVVPAAAAGWRVEVVLQAPELRHPSVVVCAPDGRVFVAEDPMDIRTPEASATEGRILCLHPDGRRTVFATGLHAVFGMQWLEGRLYVLHNPQFSVFEDRDGVGTNRTELIAQTLPEPWALNWNDHVPANFRLGLDGFFYVATGDKGLYGAVGRDGRRLDLHGGGVFRIRPDGTGLEVFSRGVRNILDVALDDDDEPFTYDNTDEHDWMGRLTHMVDGGFYGYPHDFVPRRPYTLWMMHDFGPGAATGVECYRDDALPLEWRGNLFLADFGQRQVTRVRLARDGATFRVAAHEPLFPDPPPDFRPVGIAFAPDGPSLYVCDWNFRDAKADVSVGRLFRLTWTNAVAPAAKPGWWRAAALGRPVAAGEDELVAGLSHPSMAVRQAAQRTLARRGPAVVPRLTTVLSDRSAGARARIHALWALASFDPHGLPMDSIRKVAEADPEPAVRGQVVRYLGEVADTNAVPVLVRLLSPANDPMLRRRAAVALGRLAVAEAVPSLVEVLAVAQDDPVVRYSVFTALNRIGRARPVAWTAIARALTDERPGVREGAVFALRDTYDPALLEAVLAVWSASGTSPAARAAAFQIAAALHHATPPWKGEWWAYHPALQPPPARTEPWSGTPQVLTALRQGLTREDPVIRAAAVSALGEARETNAAPALRELLGRETELSVRRAILGALAAWRDPGGATLAAGLLDDPRAGELRSEAVTWLERLADAESLAALRRFVGRQAGVAEGAIEAEPVRRAAEALGRLKDAASVEVLEVLGRRPEAAIRRTAVRALGQVGDPATPGAVPAGVKAGLSDPDPAVQREAVHALGEMKSAAARPILLEAWKNPALRLEALRGLGRAPDVSALDAFLEGLAARNHEERQIARDALAGMKAAVRPRLEARAATLSREALVVLRELYADDPAAKSGPLFAAPVETRTPEDYLDFALAHEGDVARGAALFRDPAGVNCIQCHRVAGAGGEVGPDLSGAGAQFGRRELAESVLWPSKVVREGYHPVSIELRDGTEFSGIVKSETPESIVMRDPAGTLQTIPKAEVKSRSIGTQSLMPDGLQQGLSREEFADLISYLQSLKAR